MAKTLLITVDLERIRKNMSKEDGQTVSLDEARQRLIDAGFTPHPNGWLVEELDLGQLDPSEVLSCSEAPIDD